MKAKYVAIFRKMQVNIMNTSLKHFVFMFTSILCEYSHVPECSILVLFYFIIVRYR